MMGRQDGRQAEITVDVSSPSPYPYDVAKALFFNDHNSALCGRIHVHDSGTH